MVMHNDAVVQGLSELPYMQGPHALGRPDDRHRARQRALHQSSDGETNGKDVISPCGP